MPSTSRLRISCGCGRRASRLRGTSRVGALESSAPGEVAVRILSAISLDVVIRASSETWSDRQGCALTAYFYSLWGGVALRRRPPRACFPFAGQVPSETRSSGSCAHHLAGDESSADRRLASRATSADHGDRRTGRLLPGGAAAREGLRGVRHRARLP